MLPRIRFASWFAGIERQCCPRFARGVLDVTLSGEKAGELGTNFGGLWVEACGGGVRGHRLGRFTVRLEVAPEHELVVRLRGGGARRVLHWLRRHEKGGLQQQEAQRGGRRDPGQHGFANCFTDRGDQPRPVRPMRKMTLV